MNKTFLVIALFIAAFLAVLTVIFVPQNNQQTFGWLTHPLAIEQRNNVFAQSLCSFLNAPIEARLVKPLANAIDAVSSLDKLTAYNDQSALNASSKPACNEQLGLSEREQAMLIALVYTLPGEPIIDLPAFVLSQTTGSYPLTNSLIALRNSLALFNDGGLSFYEVDQPSQLIAFQIKGKDARAYVAFNFSFDTHELPLPLGFMSSTKVKVWRSDNPKIDEFVTNTPLSIRAFSAVVVVV